MVIAVPLPLGVQGRGEHSALLQPFQTGLRLTVGAIRADHLRAQRTAQPIKDCGFQQETLDGGRYVRLHLVNQVIHHELVLGM